MADHPTPQPPKKPKPFTAIARILDGLSSRANKSDATIADLEKRITAIERLAGLR